VVGFSTLWMMLAVDLGEGRITSIPEAYAREFHASASSPRVSSRRSRTSGRNNCWWVYREARRDTRWHKLAVPSRREETPPGKECEPPLAWAVERALAGGTDY
jgi:hypothetical protein